MPRASWQSRHLPFLFLLLSPRRLSHAATTAASNGRSPGAVKTTPGNPNHRLPTGVIVATRTGVLSACRFLGFRCAKRRVPPILSWSGRLTCFLIPSVERASRLLAVLSRAARGSFAVLPTLARRARSEGSCATRRPPAIRSGFLSMVCSDRAVNNHPSSRVAPQRRPTRTALHLRRARLQTSLQRLPVRHNPRLAGDVAGVRKVHRPLFRGGCIRHRLGMLGACMGMSHVVSAVATSMRV